MTYEEFAETANRMWGRVPAAYKEGVDGLVLKREADTHPDYQDYYTLGMCFTEPYPSDYSGPESTRSILALYYGSFAMVAESDPDFSWKEEIWETITHELRHHLEFLADDDALEGVDYAMEQAHLRWEGLDFDPWYYQSGLPVSPGIYRVETEIFVEQRWRQVDFDSKDALEIRWEGRRCRIPLPPRLGDVHFIWVAGDVSPDDGLQVVLLRERSLWEQVRRLCRRAPLEVLESEAEAEVVPE